MSSFSISTEKNVPESRNVGGSPIPIRDDCIVARDGADDSTIKTTDIKTVSSFNNSGAHGMICSVPPTVSHSEGNIASMFQYIYETVEIGAETVITAACSSSHERQQLRLTNAESIKAGTTEVICLSVDESPGTVTVISRQPSIVSAISEETFPTVKTVQCSQEMNIVQGFEIRPETTTLTIDTTDRVQGGNSAEGFEVQPELCCAIIWSDHSEHDVICNNENIASEQPNLGTLSDDSGAVGLDRRTLDKIGRSSVENLLKEIDDVAKSAGMDNNDQDRFVQKMTVLKQHLVEVNNLLDSTPAGDKAEYFHGILRSAVLDAEVETRRAELELKKIRLESMRVENQIDQLAAGSVDATHSGNVLEQAWNKLKSRRMSLKW